MATTERTVDEAKAYIIETLDYWEKEKNPDKVIKIANFAERGRIAGTGNLIATQIKTYKVVTRSLENNIKKLDKLGKPAPNLQASLDVIKKLHDELEANYTPPVKRTRKSTKQ